MELPRPPTAHPPDSPPAAAQHSPHRRTPRVPGPRPRGLYAPPRPSGRPVTRVGPPTRTGHASGPISRHPGPTGQRGPARRRRARRETPGTGRAGRRSGHRGGNRPPSPREVAGSASVRRPPPALPRFVASCRSPRPPCTPGLRPPPHPTTTSAPPRPHPRRGHAALAGRCGTHPSAPGRPTPRRLRRPRCRSLRGSRALVGCGHFVQPERPEETNRSRPAGWRPCRRDALSGRFACPPARAVRPVRRIRPVRPVGRGPSDQGERSAGRSVARAPRKKILSESLTHPGPLRTLCQQALT